MIVQCVCFFFACLTNYYDAFAVAFYFEYLYLFFVYLSVFTSSVSTHAKALLPLLAFLFNRSFVLIINERVLQTHEAQTEKKFFPFWLSFI